MSVKRGVCLASLAVACVVLPALQNTGQPWFRWRLKDQQDEHHQQQPLSSVQQPLPPLPSHEDSRVATLPQQLDPTLTTKKTAVDQHEKSHAVKAPLEVSPTATTSQPLIPNNLLLNYKVSLLEADPQSLSHSEHRVKQNLLRTFTALPNMKVLFYNDTQCRAAVARVHSEQLARRFDREHYGAYKSDLCRLAMLFEHGGIYLDNDLEIVADVRQLIPQGVSLSSAMELGSHTNVFQAFFAATPGHPVLALALDLTRKRYNGHSRQLWMGPEVMGVALRSWLGTPLLKLGEAVKLDSRKGSDSRSKRELVYLFQETDNVWGYGLSPRPNGHGCCCNVAVVDKRKAWAWSRFVGASEFCSER